MSIACGKCAHYDPILGSEEKPTKRGWCIERSLYPAKEGLGQVFPRTAKRAPEGQMPKPFIVRGGAVVPACPFARESAVDPADLKKKQQATATTDKAGKRRHS